MKEMGSEVAGCSEDSQQPQPKTKNPIVRTGRPVLQEQPSGSRAQEIEKFPTAKAQTQERDGVLG